MLVLLAMIWPPASGPPSRNTARTKNCRIETSENHATLTCGRNETEKLYAAYVIDQNYKSGTAAIPAVTEKPFVLNRYLANAHYYMLERVGMGTKSGANDTPKAPKWRPLLDHIIDSLRLTANRARREVDRNRRVKQEEKKYIAGVCWPTDPRFTPLSFTQHVQRRLASRFLRTEKESTGTGDSVNCLCAPFYIDMWSILPGGKHSARAHIENREQGSRTPSENLFLGDSWLNDCERTIPGREALPAEDPLRYEATCVIVMTATGYLAGYIKFMHRPTAAKQFKKHPAMADVLDKARPFVEIQSTYSIDQGAGVGVLLLSRAVELIETMAEAGRFGNAAGIYVYDKASQPSFYDLLFTRCADSPTQRYRLFRSP